MSVSLAKPGANPFVPEVPDLHHLSAAFVTANVTTRSGSRYLVVVRPGFVTVIHEQDHWVVQGTDLHIIGGRMYLRDNDRDRTLLSTTTIERVYVLEN